MESIQFLSGNTHCLSVFILEYAGSLWYIQTELELWRWQQTEYLEYVSVIGGGQIIYYCCRLYSLSKSRPKYIVDILETSKKLYAVEIRL